MQIIPDEITIIRAIIDIILEMGFRKKMRRGDSVINVYISIV